LIQNILTEQSGLTHYARQIIDTPLSAFQLLLEIGWDIVLYSKMHRIRNSASSGKRLWEKFTDRSASIYCLVRSWSICR